MRPLAAALILLLAACGAPPQQRRVAEGMPDYRTVRVTYPSGDTHDLTLVRQDFIARSILSASGEDVWNAIPDAYEELGLPLPLLDRSRWTAAVQQHRATQRLGRERLSSYFDCGSNATGRNADSRRIVLSVYTTLEPVDSTFTRADFRVEATAHTLEGATAAPIPCTSSGQLESRLAVALQLRAVGNPR